MNTKLWVMIGLGICSHFTVHGELVVNGNMSSNYYATGGNDAQFQDLDQGWTVKSQTSIDLSVNPGKMTWNGSATTLPDSLVQVNSVSDETGDMLVLSFDWAPAAGSAHPTLDYNLVGWKVTGSPVAENDFFNFINGGGNSASGLDGNADAVDLLTGGNMGSGNSDMTVGSVTGTAGSTTNYTVSIDMSGWEAGLNDVSDYDYIGIRFKIPGDHTDLTAINSTLDNVSLVAEVPVGEPLDLTPGHTGVVTVADFFTDTISNVSETVNITDAPYNADGTDAMDDSAAMQAAIDAMTLHPNGGKIIVPAGTFHLSNLYLKSNVHLEIDPGAVLVETDGVGTMFDLGLDNNGINALVIISNVSIRASSGRYTVDLSHAAPNPNKSQFVKCKNVCNFMVADFNILDNYSKMSSVTMGTADHNGQWFQPRDGVVMNGHVVDAHYGYGLVQAQACNNILYQDLSGVGGITLRLETGAVPYDAPDTIMLHDIYGRNISITNGHGAAMMGPHYRINGHVDLDGLYAVASLYAVSAGDGFVNAAEEAAGYTPGYFADTCIIKNVHAVYGENAGYKTKNFNDIPCEERHKITAAPAYSGIIYRGPSCIAAHSNSTRFTFSNVTQEGFVYRTKAIMSKDDEIDNCPYVPVTGISLSETSLQMNVAKTAFLVETVSPVAPSDPSVKWSSNNPSVAVVGVGGAVMAVSEGTATITATTMDGGYSAACTVTVSGGGGGSWNELLNDDFESGWGNWQNGWANWTAVASEASLTNANAVGAQCAYLMGDISNSVISLSAPLDLTDYSNLKIDFSFVVGGFGVLQDFWVQFSGNDGVTWQMIDDLVLGMDFSNGVRGHASLVIDRERFNFSSQSRLRIGCDRVDGGDHVFVDDIVVSVFEQTGWGEYLNDLNLSGDAGGDTDGDSQSDLVEYALGGDAANAGITANLPTMELTDGRVRYTHEQRTNQNAGVLYQTEWTEDLLGGSWSEVWDSETGSVSGNPEFQSLEYQLETQAKTNVFMRFRLVQP